MFGKTVIHLSHLGDSESWETMVMSALTRLSVQVIITHGSENCCFLL